MTQEEIQASVARLLDNDVIRELFEKRVKQTVSNQKTRLKNAPKHEAKKAERAAEKARIEAERKAVLDSLTPEQLQAIRAMVKAEAEARLAASTVQAEPEPEAVAA